MKQTLITVAALLVAPVCLLAQTPVGTQGTVGTLAAPKTVSRLQITKPGVYENLLVDAQGKGGNIVKITADNVIVRNCEIFNGSGNGNTLPLCFSRRVFTPCPNAMPLSLSCSILSSARTPPGFENSGEHEAPAIEVLLKNGFAP